MIPRRFSRAISATTFTGFTPTPCPLRVSEIRVCSMTMVLPLSVENVISVASRVCSLCGTPKRTLAGLQYSAKEKWN